MSAKKFNTPQNAYSAVIQSAAEPETITAKKPEVYRFNLCVPVEYKDYLKEIAWRNHTTITAYLAALIAADMDAHPEWKDSFDPNLK